MQQLLRWSLVGLAVSALAACGGSKQQASSPYQQQASSSNQQQQARLTPEESASLQQASNQQQQFNQQQKAEKDKARQWYSSSSSTCAAQIPEVYISVQDAVDGVKVMYYTTSLANIDPLQKNVSGMLESGSDTARASGGAPMSSQAQELPPVDIKTTQNPDGITVLFTAKNASDADRLRDLVRSDVHNQQLGNCSALRIPKSASISGD